ncbi:neuroglobin-like [Thrips palmi]|uniref:Neuroglobin-like n=1 Tax=Thrips palmi TaxID=161013 RepID=A0A6P8YPJ2_THRPL|nr:neuroglobin-like [Thrips palmi]
MALPGGSGGERRRQASLVEALGCVGQPEDDEEDAEPPPDLTDHEKELLTTSWKEIENNVAQVGVITFISLFETHPDVQEVFMPFNGIELEDLKHSKQLRAHALRVMAFVQKAVARLNEPEKLQTLVRDLGRKHVGYGAKRRYVDLIGPQFIQAIKPSLEPQWSDEMHEAWSRLFLHLSFVMKGSMLEEERRVKAAPKGR